MDQDIGGGKTSKLMGRVKRAIMVLVLVLVDARIGVWEAEAV